MNMTTDERVISLAELIGRDVNIINGRLEQIDINDVEVSNALTNINTIISEMGDINATIYSGTGVELLLLAETKPTELFNAIWTDYNKPVWHINGIFIDAIGAVLDLNPSVDVPIEVPVDNGVAEFVYTIKTSTDNHDYLAPINDAPDGMDLDIYWGDGTQSQHTTTPINHVYENSLAGDVFQITIKGNLPTFYHGSAMWYGALDAETLISIDKNTMPKNSMVDVNVGRCTNLTYLCASAFGSSQLLTKQNLGQNKNLVLHKDVFKGCEDVTIIDNLFAVGGTSNSLVLPDGLFDYFVSVTSANALFYNMTTDLPVNAIHNMTNLQLMNDMFYASDMTTIQPDFFINQLNIKECSNAFQYSSLVFDAKVFYDYIVRGQPTAHVKVFDGAGGVTNKSQIPIDWN